MHVRIIFTPVSSSQIDLGSIWGYLHIFHFYYVINQKKQQKPNKTFCLSSLRSLCDHPLWRRESSLCGLWKHLQPRLQHQRTLLQEESQPTNQHRGLSRSLLKRWILTTMLTSSPFLRFTTTTSLRTVSWAACRCRPSRGRSRRRFTWRRKATTTTFLGPSAWS